MPTRRRRRVCPRQAKAKVPKISAKLCSSTACGSCPGIGRGVSARRTWVSGPVRDGDESGPIRRCVLRAVAAQAAHTPPCAPSRCRARGCRRCTAPCSARPPCACRSPAPYRDRVCSARGRAAADRRSAAERSRRGAAHRARRRTRVADGSCRRTGRASGARGRAAAVVGPRWLPSTRCDRRPGCPWWPDAQATRPRRDRSSASPVRAGQRLAARVPTRDPLRFDRQSEPRPRADRAARGLLDRSACGVGRAQLGPQPLRIASQHIDPHDRPSWPAPRRTRRPSRTACCPSR